MDIVVIKLCRGEFIMWFLQPGITFYDLITRMLAILVIIFLIFPLHEFAHAWMSYKLGDNTAKELGRLTLNPLAHFSTLGSVCLLLFDFGWAKPVPVDYRNLKNPKRDSALISLAGPVSNILAAMIGGLLLNFLPLVKSSSMISRISMFMYYYISINISLAIFNLVPIAPLDGYKILEAFIPERFILKYYKNLHMITIILILLLLFGFFDAPIDFLERILYNFIIKTTHIPIKF